MKRIIISLALGLVFISLFSVWAYASADATSPPVASLNILTYPERTVYGAFEQLDVSGLTLRAVYADGSESIISGSEARISYNSDKCFRVGDDSVLLSYGGKSVFLPVTVNRIAYDISGLKLEDISVIYNGLYQGYNQPVTQIVGLDGIPLSVSFSGGGINVGRYDIIVDFYSESRDYYLPKSRVVTVTVNPAAAQIVWEQQSFVYDGRSKSPTAYYLDVRGNRIYPSVSGGATNAGNGYVAKATVTDPNYEFTNVSTGFEIKKADYDFSNVVWSKDSFVYDGTKKSVSASGLPLGVSIIGYSGDRGSNAGIYTATAMISWDENNYNSPPSLTHSWEIKKADYDMSSVSFKTGSFVYDGRMHYPVLVGAMPVGADGIGLEYSFSSGAAHVNDGKVAVTISFYTASKNYNVPTDRHSSVMITPKGITVDWGQTEISYSGENQAPVAFAEEWRVNVSGAMVNVGRYIATATTSNSDYYIINDKTEYSILKANNFWTVIPSDSVCYENREMLLTGTARFGKMDVSFYSDKAATVKIPTPTKSGKYYAVITVRESENYTGLTSDVIAVEIEPIVAVSFLVKIVDCELRAFETLGEGDFSCSVINNDGSVTDVNGSLINIIYENGYCLLKKDETVRFEYGDFVLDLPVEVGYADYDLSGVKWINDSQVYDGKSKTPELVGLPDGVVISSYNGGNQILAGSYKVYVTLDYDKENYNEPIISPCDFTITKRVIAPSLITSVYNGCMQSPTVSTDLYKILSFDERRDAGEYPVLVELTDSANYTFSDGTNRAYAIFKILPAKISVRVEDVMLRLFERLDAAEYFITDGTVYEGDALTVSTYREGKSVFVASNNQNYVFEVIPGRLIRLPYPTLDTTARICTSILLILIVLIAVLIGLRNRHRISGVLEIIKCRWHNRGYKAPLPTFCEGSDDIDCGIAESFDREIDHMEGGVAEAAKESELPDITVAEFEIDAERANSLISDALAKKLINREGEIVYTNGCERAIVNIELLSKNFSAGERIDVNELKKKGLVSDDTAYIKILGGGSLDKPLMVYANDFSLSAVKMIALTGGSVTKVVTFRAKKE